MSNNTVVVGSPSWDDPNNATVAAYQYSTNNTAGTLHLQQHQGPSLTLDGHKLAEVILRGRLVKGH
jgi:hypothetical protein